MKENHHEFTRFTDDFNFFLSLVIREMTTVLEKEYDGSDVPCTTIYQRWCKREASGLGGMCRGKG